MQAGPTTTAIIGGGFCGAMTAVHLLEGGAPNRRIILFDRSVSIGNGIAYSTYSEQHLLNVPAGNMSAFPDRPDHFVEWVKRNENVFSENDHSLRGDYLPRSLYGRYLNEIFSTAAASHQDQLMVVHDKVVVCKKQNDTFTIVTEQGRVFNANHTVLATGNALPGKPKGIPASFLNSPLYFNNPWDERSVSDYSDKWPVLIAGTGLTMVDVVIGLREKGYSGKIVALSPKGFEILPRRTFNPQPAILEALQPPYHLHELISLFKKHVREVSGRGISGEAIVDAVRTKTPEIWASLSFTERQRFLTHLRHMWGVARHRLPQRVFDRMRAEITAGKLSIVPGRILDVDESDTTATVTYYNRLLREPSEVKAGRIINCTGPKTDVRCIQNPLFEQMIQDGMIDPDPLGMGIHCDADGHPITASGIPESEMFALGSLLKGDLWESTAVPELRNQAHRTARCILESRMTENKLRTH